jgi:predicted ribosome quality control (RQC) complex YloA/Tae2 family protein
VTAPELKNPPEVWAYELPGGWTVWAGKTDRDNDHLSCKVARNDDLWFHVRGVPGSHVVLFVREGQEPPREVVDAAAAIAAWHSKARNGGTVPVSCCTARDVSKPRGVPAGTVYLKRERVLKVKPGVPG